MKLAINIVLWMLMGLILTISDLGPDHWQYWVIYLCIFGISLNLVLW